MKCVPPLEAKNKNLDQLGNDLQKRMDDLDTRVDNLEKIVKKLVVQKCTILKTIANNFNTLLIKLE